MKKFYNVSVLLLSAVSIFLALLDISNVININNPPFIYIDKSILVIFWIDYIVRFYK